VPEAATKLLLVEDERIVRITVRDALARAGYRVTDLSDGASALRAAEAERFDIVLTDVRLPGLDGIALFRRIRQINPDAAVLLFTAHAELDDAVAVMREGARDYIQKPFEMEELLLRLGRVRDELAFRRAMETGAAERPVPGRMPIRGISAATRRLVERIEAAAATDVNVLITGETGTGKDLCARTIHDRSRRAPRPFVAVNCAALPETLLEAELFGHEKGAFTGADRRRAGRFATANGGTLFLDEVGELPLAAQVKLLRVLETSTFEPVGTSKSVTVDVRIIAATNRDLAEAAAKGTFRQDLFYRLNVVDIETPPLRHRPGDIPVLVSEFLADIAARQGRPAPPLDPSAIAALATYRFPGNVRELIHALERAVAVARGGVIRLEHLPPAISSTAEGDAGAAVDEGPPDEGQVEPLASAITRFERQYIRRVLDRTGGHRGRAAALLGISRKALWLRLRGEGGGEEPEPDDDDVT
jgi:two-component system response regulator AtoC